MEEKIKFFEKEEVMFLIGAVKRAAIIFGLTLFGLAVTQDFSICFKPALITAGGAFFLESAKHWGVDTTKSTKNGFIFFP